MTLYCYEPKEYISTEDIKHDNIIRNNHILTYLKTYPYPNENWNEVEARTRIYNQVKDLDKADEKINYALNYEEYTFNSIKTKFENDLRLSLLNLIFSGFEKDVKLFLCCFTTINKIKDKMSFGDQPISTIQQSEHDYIVSCNINMIMEALPELFNNCNIEGIHRIRQMINDWKHGIKRKSKNSRTQNIWEYQEYNEALFEEPDPSFYFQTLTQEDLVNYSETIINFWKAVPNNPRFNKDIIKTLKQHQKKNDTEIPPETIKKIRDNIGKNQKDFSKIIKVSKNQLSKWEKGEEIPSVGYILLLKMIEKHGIDTIEN